MARVPMNTFDILLAFSMSSIACMLLMPVLIKYAHVLGMIDAPDARKVHVRAIPRSGGIAIAASALLTILSLVAHDAANLGLCVGGLVIVVFGLLDDALDLHYGWKFFGQFVAVMVVVVQGIQLHALPFFGLDLVPVWIAAPLTILFVIGGTNAVNLSDGLDGLAAGSLLLTFAFIAIFAAYSGGNDVTLMAVAIGGGLFGFLRYNTHPAIVFMGDTGSQFIGFMAANLSILLTQEVNTVLNPALPLLILGLPILDTLSVIIQRLRAGTSPFSADRRHIHHKLLSYGLQHPHAVAMIYLIQTAFLIGAFLFRYAADWQVVGYYLLLSSMILLGFHFADKYNFTLGSLSSSERRARRFFRSQWLFMFCRRYIETALLLFLLIATVVVIMSADIGWAQEMLLLLLAIVLCRFLPYGFQATLIRMSIYIAGTSVIYLDYDLPLDKQTLDMVADIFLAGLVLVTSLAIRVTRKSYFRLNNQDLLVVLLFMVAITLIKAEYLVRAIVYLSCLGYATEYLLHRDIYHYRVLRFLALLCMANVVFYVGSLQ